MSDAELRRHTLIAGATGSGKSRIMRHLVLRQVLHGGCSLVLLDPKGELYQDVLRSLAEEKFPPERTILVDPRTQDSIPGWNPFLEPIPVNQVANDIAALVERSATTRGPRMMNLLQMALIVVAVQRLSFFEFTRLLLRDDYRVALLRQPLQTDDVVPYQEARYYLLEDFGRWSNSERVQASAAVLNKVSEILRAPYLRALLCSRRNTLTFSELWRKQTVVLVRLDRTELGEEGSRLLAGLLASSLFQTALRSSGSVPVVLGIDELPVFERFVGQAVSEIVTQARSQGLRLVVALQHLSQLSAELRDALLTNAALRLFFRCGSDDARAIAPSLASDARAGVEKLEVTRATRDECALVWRAHPILDPEGHHLQVSRGVWAEARQSLSLGPDPVSRLEAWAQESGVPRLFVRAADSGEPFELRHYLRGLDPQMYRIRGPQLMLDVSFPTPRLAVLKRTGEGDAVRSWGAVLQDLPVQHAVVRRIAKPASLIRLVEVPATNPSSSHVRDFVSRSAEECAQDRAEIAQTREQRIQVLEDVAAGRPRPLHRLEVEDGSIG